jgi:cytochrome c
MARSYRIAGITALGVIIIASSVVGIRYWENREQVINIAVRLTGGDPQRGRIALREYGCTSCHMVPGVMGSKSTVAPPLIHFALRAYIAGEFPNTPANLRHWIQKPHELRPRTIMPETGINDQDTSNVAAYLYTLK